MAEVFDIPENNIRWLSLYIGGAYGIGNYIRAEYICIMLAKKTLKPVKLVYTREEDFVATGTRQPFIQTGKIGVKKDGTIIALQTKSITNAGAYFVGSRGIARLYMHFFLGLYPCANVAGEANIVYTNIPTTCSFRGIGTPQAMFALEQLVDMAAEKIGVDPVEFRLKNIKKAGELTPYDPPFQMTHPVESTGLQECIKVGAERIGWKEKRGRKQEGVRRRGVGMAIMMYYFRATPLLFLHRLEYSNAFIKLNEDGSADLVVSAYEIGQNFFGVLGQIAAEELGLHAEDIHVISGDTDITAFHLGFHTSWSNYCIGNAVQKAAAAAKGQLLQRAAERLEVPADEVEARDGRVYVKATPEKGLSIGEVVRGATYYFKEGGREISGSGSFVQQSYPPHTHAVFAEVEVDMETGEVRILKLLISNDSGRSINPMGLEGQVEGGAVIGLGYALTEDYVINSDTGKVESDNFTTYRIPSTLDTPEIEVILVEKPDPRGPFGAKVVGEASPSGIAPAIANAIYDAVGVRIKDLPITPEKILKALRGH